MTVIGSAGAVLTDRAAEFGHRDYHDVFHAVAHVTIKGGQTLSEFSQTIRKLASLVALIGVCVPARDVGESDFKPDVGFDELCDLQQRLSKRRRWISRTILGLVLLRVGFFQHVHRFRSCCKDISRY